MYAVDLFLITFELILERDLYIDILGNRHSGSLKKQTFCILAIGSWVIIGNCVLWKDGNIYFLCCCFLFFIFIIIIFFFLLFVVVMVLWKGVGGKIWMLLNLLPNNAFYNDEYSFPASRTLLFKVRLTIYDNSLTNFRFYWEQVQPQLKITSIFWQTLIIN